MQSIVTQVMQWKPHTQTRGGIVVYYIGYIKICVKACLLVFACVNAKIESVSLNHLGFAMLSYS